MRVPATFFLAAIALAAAQGCTAPAATNAVPAHSSPPPVVGPPMAGPPPSAAAIRVLNRRLQFRNGPGAFISSEDYPAAAREARQQGTVRFRLTVSPQGRVTDCNILQSSGHSILDSSLCGLMSRRARFAPTTDANGNPVASSIDEQYSWKLPGSR